MAKLAREERAQLIALVHDFFRYQLNKLSIQWSAVENGHSKVTAFHDELRLALRDLGDGVLETSRERIDVMARQLDVRDGCVDDLFRGVIHEMFAEGIEWNRIVFVFVFAVEVAHRRYRRSKAKPECISQTAQLLTDSLALTVVPWLRTNSGWSGLIRHREQQHALTLNPAVVFEPVCPGLFHLFIGAAGIIIVILCAGAYVRMR
ncbi:induced myeloid leukemia cell differentiation protein Mcl-1 homolog [Varroa destructor]|uniref:Bcl-2 Bcl-2 homology region 1-3 domain-containing protein n=1 Tax=Varroa destructor TaxID=109461 RepID=A0A7M7IY57_VARDE|nr:induced myeloid leukemia cell differentiation protein Mcl-1 homolog [Varroa destructor]